MRFSMIVAGLVVSLGAGRSFAADPLLLDRPDLHAHFWLSYGVALTLTEILEGPEPGWGPGWGTAAATGVATVVVGLLGVAKELTDAQAQGDDLLADALGLAANALLQFTVEF